VTGRQPPCPSDSYPETQISGTSDVTQFPFPSVLYPDGHYGDATTVGGALVGATQFPFPSLCHPEAQVDTGTEGLTEIDGEEIGRQVPSSSAVNPDGQSALILVGTGIASQTQVPSDLCCPVEHPLEV